MSVKSARRRLAIGIRLLARLSIVATVWQSIRAGQGDLHLRFVHALLPAPEPAAVSIATQLHVFTHAVAEIAAVFFVGGLGLIAGLACARVLEVGFEQYMAEQAAANRAAMERDRRERWRHALHAARNRRKRDGTSTAVVAFAFIAGWMLS